MKVLFAGFSGERHPFISSISALSAYLRERGVEVSFINIRGEGDLSGVRERLSDFAPLAIALSFSTFQRRRVVMFMDVVKGADLPVIAGGPDPTLHPREVMEIPGIDFIVRGDGEEPLFNFLRGPGGGVGDAEGIRGIYSPSSPNLHFSPIDPDSLPFWDRELFFPGRFPELGGNPFERGMGIKFGKGICPFRCSFCSNEEVRRVWTSGPVRLRSPGRVVEEMEALEKRYSPPAFSVWDEILPLNRAFIEGLSGMTGRRLSTPLRTHLHTSQVDRDLARMLRRGGVDFVVLGLECGDEEYRRGVLKKPFTNREARDAIRFLLSEGIDVHGTFMIGLPFETERMVLKTLGMAEEIQPATVSIAFYRPVPGTPLFDLCRREGILLEGEDWEGCEKFGGKRPYIKTPGVGEDFWREVAIEIEGMRKEGRHMDSGGH